MMAFLSRTLPPLLPPQSPISRYHEQYEWLPHSSSSSSSCSLTRDIPMTSEPTTWQRPAYHSRAPAPVLPPASLFEPRLQKLPSFDGPAPPGLVHPGHSQSFTHLFSAAPMVSEISHDDYFYDDPPKRCRTAGDLQRFRPQREAQQPKAPQDSNAGGVSAHLDYDMDDMTDFVTVQAQRVMFGPSRQIDGFRKFVSGVLTSTRLPSSTIILALSYLSDRISLLYRNGIFDLHDEDLRQLLTLSLLLASKFLDDNTFQNKSWSEVTRIDVKVINNLEIQWMIDYDWRLGLFDSHNRQVWQEWAGLWSTHIATQKEEARIVKQARIADDDLRTRHLIQSMQPSSRRQSIPQIRVQPVPYTPDPWAHMYSQQNTPPSAPDTAPPTPEYWPTSQCDWGQSAGLSISPYSLLHTAGYPNLTTKSAQNTPVQSFFDSVPELALTHSHNPWHQQDCSCKPGHRSSAIYPSWGLPVQSQSYQYPMILGQG